MNIWNNSGFFCANKCGALEIETGDVDNDHVWQFYWFHDNKLSDLRGAQSWKIHVAFQWCWRFMLLVMDMTSHWACEIHMGLYLGHLGLQLRLYKWVRQSWTIMNHRFSPWVGMPGSTIKKVVDPRLELDLHFQVMIDWYFSVTYQGET